LESASSHEIPRKIRQAKKLDIKIRKTKELAANGLISITFVAALQHSCGDEILSQGCASQERLWISDSQVEDSLSLRAVLEHTAVFVEGVDALVVNLTKKRSHAALLIPLALIVIDGGLRIWWAESIPGGFLSAAGAVVLFVLEIRGRGLRSWIDEEVKPRKGEGKGGLL